MEKKWDIDIAGYDIYDVGTDIIDTDNNVECDESHLYADDEDGWSCSRHHQDEILLTNPWSGADVSPMTWDQIKEWAKEHNHPRDLVNWLYTAHIAFARSDSDILGKMIIGS